VTSGGCSGILRATDTVTKPLGAFASDANKKLPHDVRYVYEGGNLLASLNPASSVRQAYLWGLDLSGTMQGAGGVGGLLAITDASTGSHFCTFDGNGNVTALVKADGAGLTAQYEYGPFGELLRATGPMARANPFRFSTKYQDDETDLIYYGYRYYNPSTGRWPNRDPLEERGGVNLYGFVKNDPLTKFDPDGRQPQYIQMPQNGDSPQFPQDGCWMCKEELIGKHIFGILHHRFIVCNGDARGFEKRSRWLWGGPGGVRNEYDQPVHHDVRCYKLECLNNDCATRIFDKAVSSGQGKSYWLGFRDCQSWANNVERSMYKSCSCCPKNQIKRRFHWKLTGFSETKLDPPSDTPELPQGDNYDDSESDE